MLTVNKKLILLPVAALTALAATAADAGSGESLPKVNKVWEFVPAPGQFVNSKGFTTAEVLVNGEGMISLGGFGGYVVLGFDKPVPNDSRNPYGVDFTIAGNAFEAAARGYWSEPGAVMVMRDDNGEPDDTWYELAGSNYWFDTSRRGVSFTYHDPGYISRYYIPYTASDGRHGAVPSNQFHQQSYFPDPAIYGDVKLDADGSLTLTGTHINAVYDLRMPSYIECYRPLAFGYCDNHATKGDLSDARNPYHADDKGSVADGFDISWAVDADGNYVELDHIDFIKIYNTVNQSCGWLGESSTEVASIAVTRPDAAQEQPGDYYINYAGITQLQVAEGHTCRYEGFAFHNGRPMRDAVATWSTEDPEVATIDADGVLTALKPGVTKVHFSATDKAADDVFEVEVVKLSGVKIAREGNATTVSDSKGIALPGEMHYYQTYSVTEGGSPTAGEKANNYIYDSYTWSSSDSEVASIEAGGFFRTLKPGTTVLTAVSDTDPSLSTTFELTVAEMPEIKRFNNYLVIEDATLDQEALAAKVFACNELFDASFKDGRATYRKRVELSIVKVEPDGFDDMFYIEGNNLCNRLVKGDWREYLLTVEGRLGEQTCTIEMPVLHTGARGSVEAPEINADARLLIDGDSRSGSLDLAEVFVVKGSPALYAPAYRLASGSTLPEGYSAAIQQGVLTVSMAEGTALEPGLCVEVEGRVNRATQKASAPALEPEAPEWHKVAIPLAMTTGVQEPGSTAEPRLFPNPAVYSFSLDIDEPAAVKLWTLAGALLLDTTLQPGEAVDVSGLQPGIYLVQACGRTMRLVKK